LISAKNAPVQELLKDGESALLIERANPDALAIAIRKLKNDSALRNRIAENGYQVFQKHCTQQVFAARLKTIIEEMVRYGSRN
jgi:glycosyltransferase involved in cell wall biosynthesis